VTQQGYPTTSQGWSKFSTTFGYRVQGIKWTLSGIGQFLRSGKFPSTKPLKRQKSLKREKSEKKEKKGKKRDRK